MDDLGLVARPPAPASCARSSTGTGSTFRPALQRTRARPPLDTAGQGERLAGQGRGAGGSRIGREYAVTVEGSPDELNADGPGSLLPHTTDGRSGTVLDSARHRRALHPRRWPGLRGHRGRAPAPATIRPLSRSTRLSGLDRYTIEVAPSPDAGGRSRHRRHGAVGSRYVGWLHLVSLRGRCWHARVDADLSEAVHTPRRLATDPRLAHRLLHRRHGGAQTGLGKRTS